MKEERTKKKVKESWKEASKVKPKKRKTEYMKNRRPK